MAATTPLHPAKSILVPAALTALLLGHARPGAAFSFGRTNDVWDVSQGATVANASGVLLVSSANDMFGGSDSTVETGTSLFRDDQDAGFVHFVEWHTPSPVTIQAFNLYANDDGSSGDRGFTTFRLFVKNTNTSMFDQVSTFTAPSNPFTLLDADAPFAYSSPWADSIVMDERREQPSPCAHRCPSP